MSRRIQQGHSSPCARSYPASRQKKVNTGSIAGDSEQTGGDCNFAKTTAQGGAMRPDDFDIARNRLPLFDLSAEAVTVANRVGTRRP